MKIFHILIYETYFTSFSSVSIVDFEQVNVIWNGFMNHKLGTACMHELTLVHTRGYDQGVFQVAYKQNIHKRGQ